jgi:hypothetical protein
MPRLSLAQDYNSMSAAPYTKNRYETYFFDRQTSIFIIHF